MSHSSRKEKKGSHAAKTGDQSLRVFKDLTEQFAALARDEGLKVVPYNGSFPYHFSTLDEETRARIHRRFAEYFEICSSVRAEGHSVFNENIMLWRAFKRYGLIPKDDLFSHLTDDDVVEIYLNPEFVQVYRSFKFYKFCSYTLDDLLCRPWWDLYDRDQSITDHIQEVVVQAVAEGRHQILNYNIGVSTLQERNSMCENLCQQEMRFVSPLFDKTNQIAAVVNVVRPISLTMLREPDLDAETGHPELELVKKDGE